MSKINNNRKGCKDVFRSFLVRNADYDGSLEMPCIKPVDAIPNKLTVFSKSLRSKDFNSFVHFFEDDVEFERIWNAPNRYLPILRKFDGVITPDFSLYRDMPLVMQEWNTYRSRAIGHWLQENGITVIPNIRFSDERSYSFCCDGVAKGGTIAVGSHGCIKIKVERYYFEKGLYETVHKLEPKRIIVYGSTPDYIFDDYIKSGIEIIQYDSDCSSCQKGGECLMGTGYHGGFGNTNGATVQKEINIQKEISNEVPQTPDVKKGLIDELIHNNVKISVDDVVFITRDKSNQIVWLEKGNSTAGLEHIINGNGETSGHAKDFERAFGVSKEQIPDYLNKVISHGTIIENKLVQKGNRNGFERIYYYEGKHYVVTGIGTNGFIVSAYPKKMKGDK